MCDYPNERWQEGAGCCFDWFIILVKWSQLRTVTVISRSRCLTWSRLDCVTTHGKQRLDRYHLMETSNQKTCDSLCNVVPSIYSTSPVHLLGCLGIKMKKKEKKKENQSSSWVWRSAPYLILSMWAVSLLTSGLFFCVSGLLFHISWPSLCLWTFSCVQAQLAGVKGKTSWVSFFRTLRSQLLHVGWEYVDLQRSIDGIVNTRTPPPTPMSYRLSYSLRSVIHRHKVYIVYKWLYIGFRWIQEIRCIYWDN